MLSAVRKSFVTTVGTADNLNEDTLKSGWKAIVTIGTFAAVIVASLLFSNHADDKDKKKVSESVEEMKKSMAVGNRRSVRKTKVKPVVAKKIHSHHNHSTKNRDLAMIENSLPSVLSSQSLSQRIIKEVKHNHRWLGVVFFYSDADAHLPQHLQVVDRALVEALHLHELAVLPQQLLADFQLVLDGLDGGLELVLGRHIVGLGPDGERVQLLMTMPRSGSIFDRRSTSSPQSSMR